MPLTAIRKLFGGQTDEVLVLHPDDGTREVILAFLGTLGYRAIEAAYREEAKKAVRRASRLKLMLVGLKLDRESGPAFVKAWRAEEKTLARVPVLFLAETAGDGDEQKLTARLPRTALLARPYTAKSVGQAVARLLDGEEKPSESGRREETRTP